MSRSFSIFHMFTMFFDARFKKYVCNNIGVLYNTVLVETD